jgi:hypothetical protein
MSIIGALVLCFVAPVAMIVLGCLGLWLSVKLFGLIFS